MKKSILAITFLVIITILASCKSVEKCPAYGKAESHSSAKNS